MFQGAGKFQNTHNPNQDYEVSPPPSDSVSRLAWSPRANFLVGAAWDKQVRLWEVMQSGQTQAKASIQHEAPVLSCCWSDDGSKVFSGGCDKRVNIWDLAQNKIVNTFQHDAPVSFVHWWPDKSMLMSGGWDKTLRYWDGRQPQAAFVFQLPERLYSADVRGQLCVVATADRKISIFNLAEPQKVYKQIDSPLKFQTRVVRCFPDQRGFAVGSLEGRVAIHYIEQHLSSGNFAFKCHRTETNHIYSVNDIAFSSFGTFATVGSDGCMHFWDKDSRQRLKQFKRGNMSLTCGAFNADSTIFAYASCYDWSKGANGYNPQQMPNHILLHAVRADEIQPRPAK